MPGPIGICTHNGSWRNTCGQVSKPGIEKVIQGLPGTFGDICFFIAGAFHADCNMFVCRFWSRCYRPRCLSPLTCLMPGIERGLCCGFVCGSTHFYQYLKYGDPVNLNYTAIEIIIFKNINGGMTKSFQPSSVPGHGQHRLQQPTYSRDSCKKHINSWLVRNKN